MLPSYENDFYSKTYSKRLNCCGYSHFSKLSDRREKLTAYRINADTYESSEAQAAGWQRLRLPLSLGKCYLDRFELEPGVSLVYSEFNPKKNLIEESIQHDGQLTFCLTFSLQGVSCYEPQQLAEPLTFRRGRQNACLFSQIKGNRRYQAETKVEQYRVIFTQQAFQRYDLSNLQPPAPGKFRQYFGDLISQQSYFYLQKLKRLHAGHVTERPLEKKIIACHLLSEQLTKLQVTEPDTKLRPDDEDKLLQAYQTMYEQMHQPLSITYLCQMIGMSESKFKKQFKQLFQQTPYQLLTEIRMETAWELLHQHLSVSQVAFRVGYEHPSNFSHAFRQHFGYAPKSVK
jgi:AraC-like DNA-binding protein